MCEARARKGGRVMSMMYINIVSQCAISLDAAKRMLNRALYICCCCCCCCSHSRWAVAPLFAFMSFLYRMCDHLIFHGTCTSVKRGRFFFSPYNLYLFTLSAQSFLILFQSLLSVCVAAAAAYDVHPMHTSQSRHADPNHRSNYLNGGEK